MLDIVCIGLYTFRLHMYTICLDLIHTLVENAFLSRRQFERTFSKSVGASPKQFLKIVRFQNALNLFSDL